MTLGSAGEGHSTLEVVDMHVHEAATGQRGLQVRWRSRENRERPEVDRDDLLDPEELDRRGSLAGPHRVVAADRQEREIRPVELADERQVAEDRRVSGVVDPATVLELDDEPGRLAEIEGTLARGGPITRRVVGRDHRDPEAPGGDGAALVHPDDLDAGAGKPVLQPERELVDHRPGRLRPPGNRERVGIPNLPRCRSEMVVVAVAHEHQAAGGHVRGGLRARRVAEPGVEQDRLAAGGDDLDAGVAVPGDRRRSHRRNLHGHPKRSRRYPRSVPAERIAESLAFINWTVLTGLSIGPFAAVALVRVPQRATRG